MTEPKQPKTYEELVREFEDSLVEPVEPPVPPKVRRFRPSWRKVGLVWSALVNITSLLLFITAGVLALVGDLTIEALFFGLVGLFNMSQWGRDVRSRR